MYYDSAFIDVGGLMSLWSKHCRHIPPRCHLCGQDLERNQARRSPGGATDEVRVHHQSESREADRINDTPECIGQSRSELSDEFGIQNLY